MIEMHTTILIVFDMKNMNTLPILLWISIYLDDNLDFWELEEILALENINTRQKQFKKMPCKTGKIWQMSNLFRHFSQNRKSSIKALFISLHIP